MPKNESRCIFFSIILIDSVFEMDVKTARPFPMKRLVKKKTP